MKQLLLQKIGLKIKSWESRKEHDLWKCLFDFLTIDIIKIVLILERTKHRRSIFMLPRFTNSYI